MNKNPDHFKLVFNNNEKGIPDILDECFMYLINSLNQNIFEESLLLRIKWVVTELLSNSVKHSGKDECTLHLKIVDEHLIIEKRDLGNPLSIKNPESAEIISWPLASTEKVRDLYIYNNGMDSLKVITDHSNLATFYVEELLESEMPALLSDTSEHFGLLIITKASDNFVYEYDSKLAINRFSVRFNL